MSRKRLPVLDLSGFGLHGGVGTDVTLGLAFGGGPSYTYTDSTTMTVYVITANSLFDYKPGETGIYFVAGVHAGYLRRVRRQGFHPHAERKRGLQGEVARNGEINS